METWDGIEIAVEENSMFYIKFLSDFIDIFCGVSLPGKLPIPRFLVVMKLHVYITFNIIGNAIKT